LGLVRRPVAHSPEKSALRVWLVGSNVQRSLIRLQPSDYPETRLINCTLGLFGIFKSDADLVTDFWMLILLQVGDWLGEIVFEKVKECSVVVFRDTTVL
jgi:hypothetical protein